MLVVSNTSPLSNLAVIGRLEFVRKQFKQVCVPSAVRLELRALSHAAGQSELANAFADGWLVEFPIPQDAPYPDAVRHLDKGETEAIRLALARKADCVLIDEKEGRKAAAQLALEFSGAVGVLIAARQKGWIPALKPELLVLRTEAGFFLSPRFFTDALAVVGETA